MITNEKMTIQEFFSYNVPASHKAAFICTIREDDTTDMSDICDVAKLTEILNNVMLHNKSKGAF